MFRTVPLSIIRSFFTAHRAMVYVLKVCCVCSEKTPDDGQRNCPKHVDFYFKNKFEKLMYLVGFIIRIYHDALSPERQGGKVVGHIHRQHLPSRKYSWYPFPSETKSHPGPQRGRNGVVTVSCLRLKYTHKFKLRSVMPRKLKK